MFDTKYKQLKDKFHLIVLKSQLVATNTTCAPIYYHKNYLSARPVFLFKLAKTFFTFRYYL